MGRPRRLIFLLRAQEVKLEGFVYPSEDWRWRFLEPRRASKLVYYKDGNVGDSNGVIHWLLVSYILAAEGQALVDGLQSALSQGFWHVEMEGDSNILVDAINSGSSSP
ncbi:hypothetical protein ACFX2F_021869 [Malus domestica]